MNQFHVSFPGMGIENITINRVAFSFELAGYSVNIYWYGILMAFAFLLCMFLCMKQAPRHGIKSDDIVDTFLLIMPLGIIGARIYYVIFSWNEFKDDLMRVFQTRYGGLAFYGGVIGGILAIWIMAKVKKIRFLHFLDFFAVYLPLGQAIGRWGNFFNQEAFGGNTDLPWGMISEETRRYLGQLGGSYAANSPVHPTFLYEFVANLIIFILLYQIRKNSKRNGQTTFAYLLCYGAVRFLVEGLRTDPLYIGGTQWRVSQVLSAAMVLVALIALIIVARRSPNKLQPEEGESEDFEALTDEEAEWLTDAEKASAETEGTEIEAAIAAPEPTAEAEETETCESDEAAETTGHIDVSAEGESVEAAKEEKEKD